MSYTDMLAPFEYSQVKALQDDDEWCKEEAKSAFDERDAQEGEIFRGVGGILFQRRGPVHPDRILLPLAIRAHVVRKCHEVILRGHREHHSLVDTLDMISTLFYFRGAHDAARSLLRHCRKCASHHVPNQDAKEDITRTRINTSPVSGGYIPPPQGEPPAQGRFQLQTHPQGHANPPRNQGKKRRHDNHRRAAVCNHHQPHQNQGQAFHRQWNVGQIHLGSELRGIVSHALGTMTITLPGNVEIKIPA